MKHELRVLFWEATLRCNAYCSFCGSKCGNYTTVDELSEDEICAAFCQIAERYDPSRIMINVTGGEPLVRKDLFRVMKYATSLGYSWGIVTNGILLNRQNMEMMKDSGCKTISVSLDGCEKTHERLRGVKGCYSSIINSIRQLREMGFLDVIMVTTVVSKLNINELETFKEFMKGLPVDIWRICAVDPIGRARKNNDVLLSPSETHLLAEFIHSCRREHLPFTVTTSCSHYFGAYELKLRETPFLCMAGKQVGSILANGDIFVCPNVPRMESLIQGNVLKDNFADVWENQFTCFRDSGYLRKGKCSTCEFFANCRGDSFHTWDFDNEQQLFCAKEIGLTEAVGIGKVTKRKLTEIIEQYKKPGEKLVGIVVRPQSPAKDQVIISPAADGDIRKIFDVHNQYEQVGVLLGNIYQNASYEEEAFIVDIKKVVEIKPEYTSADKMLISDTIYEQADRIEQDQSVEEDTRTEVVGFIHSHPGDLNIAMSLGDYEWHKSLYQKGWKKALTIIINMQRSMFAAYAGPAANHVELQMLKYC